ncbi:Aspartate--ammonia ligase [Eubacterium plexicaudatum ASF492]|uniref:Aspartate--ammonia ligase n=1 Tax=Eubacterium plexicaudatum ASF492 TaxID=1235802 RepID=N2BC02_9FIRM|nr:Aspartate--ammonia ligase [Eubacterium plexicaudatum ASF492]
MEHLLIPDQYQSKLNLHDTQIAIKTVKDFFQNLLSLTLNLSRVSAPLFVTPESGLNDNLNGVERPVSFDIKEMNGQNAEVVHSLAKWKRFALHKYGFCAGEGLYTDMNAIRRDEETDNIHSIFVDQWDWEKVITKEDRTIDYLKDTVKMVYKVLRKTEKYMAVQYDYIHEILPHDIYFLTTQQLEDMYPDQTPKEREYHITKEKGAVCLMQIGDKLASGEKHDGRAPDYDDWALNADILVYYPVLDIALELSSMGIRVDEKALTEQLKKAGCPQRANLPFQAAILNKELPYTIGGGIGQSRICMFFLRKAHIGEVQCSIWNPDMAQVCADHGIQLL